MGRGSEIQLQVGEKINKITSPGGGGGGTRISITNKQEM